MPATASSLCLIPYPYQVSPLEGPRGGQMASDASHNLYVVDTFNNRVLRYDDPLTRDRQPDKVWGQRDFSSRDCNRGFSQPAADRLCTGEPDHFLFNFYFSGGVDVTPDGSAIWVADLGNHRVLRFPTNGNSANLVLGQPNMTSQNGCDGTLATLCKPNGVRFDPTTNRLYVSDGDGDGSRVLVYQNPTTNGQPASTMLLSPAGSTFASVRGLTMDPVTPGAVWLTDSDNSRLLQYVNNAPAKVLGQPALGTVGCVGFPGDGVLGPQLCNPEGGIGIDRDGTVYVGDMIDQHVERFRGPQRAPNPDTAHSPDAYLLNDDHFVPNKIGPAGLHNPDNVLLGPFGMVIADQQRLLFWRNYAVGGPSGGGADGVLGQDDAFSYARSDITHGQGFVALAADATRQLLYAVNGDFITVWNTQNGLVNAAPPTFQIASPLPLRGGGTIDFHSRGIAIDAATDTAWISDSDRHRIMRIINVSQPTRQVDTVLGQPSATSTDCNRGAGRPSPLPNGFCVPEQVTFDRLGNLYVIDGTWESNGNQRALEFNRASLPGVPSPRLFWLTGGPMPARVYAKKSFTDVACDPDFVNQPCTPRYVSFEPGTNRMILTVDACGATCSTNPLESRAFIYNNPVPAGVVAPTPSGRVPLMFNQAGSSAFDAAGRLALSDHTWSRVMLVQAPPH